MDNIELQKIWRTNDQKMNRILAINKELAINLTRKKLNKNIAKLYIPKGTAVIIGVPYTVLMIAVTVFATMAKAYMVAIGFGAIALITFLLLLNYFHQLYLIGQMRSNDDILSTQQQLAELKISSFKGLNLAVFQLPFWSICWLSLDALIESPLVYGGINLLMFLLLFYISYWLYQQMSYKNKESKYRDFFLSGSEWEPIIKSEEILKQIREYQK